MKRLLSPPIIALAITLLALGGLLTLQGQTRASAPPQIEALAVPDRPAAQITLIFPTATRTPTPINLGNFVWDDLDLDGRQDPGEPGLANITVQLWDSAKTTMIDSDVTDANGSYTVVAPLPGDYRIRVVLPSILDQFSPKDNAAAGDSADSDINPSGLNAGFTDIISIASNVISITNIDAGIIKFRTPTPTRTPTPINIGNFIWDDLDQDGRQDAGEPGLPNVTVQLWDSAKTTLIDSDVTDANGGYALVAPLPGNYRVRVVLPSILDQFSPKDNPAAGDTADSDINPSGLNAGFTDILSIASNVISITSIDAGIIKFRTATPTRTPTPVNLGNFVWHDLNGNGVQDGGEPGLGGITVQLWNSTKTQLIDSTITNASGGYTLQAPQPMSVRIRVVLPAFGTSFTVKDSALGSDTTDSDINPIGVDAGFTDIINIAANVISITNIDAGLLNVLETATPTATLTPTETPTSTETSTPTLTPTETPSSTPTYTLDPSITPTVTLTPTETPTSTLTPTPSDTPTETSTLDPSITLTPTPTDEIDPFITETPLPTPVIVAVFPTPPDTPDCDLRGTVPEDVMRAGVRAEFDLFCRTLVQHRQFVTYYGVPITSIANVGREELIQMGIIHAVDLFSPSGQTYFEGGYVACLQGTGTLIWLDANNAPRVPVAIGSYTVPEWPGFTCATLFTPGTIVLVDGLS